MSWAGAYRGIKVKYDSDDGRDLESEGFHPNYLTGNTDMDSAKLQAIISAKLARGSTTSESSPENNSRPKHPL